MTYVPSHAPSAPPKLILFPTAGPMEGDCRRSGCSSFLSMSQAHVVLVRAPDHLGEAFFLPLPIFSPPGNCSKLSPKALTAEDINQKDPLIIPSLRTPPRQTNPTFALDTYYIIVALQLPPCRFPPKRACPSAY